MSVNSSDASIDAKAKPKPKRNRRVPKSSAQKIKGLSNPVAMRIPPSVDMSLLQLPWSFMVDDLIKQTHESKVIVCGCSKIHSRAKKMLRVDYKEKKLIADSQSKLKLSKSIHKWADWAKQVTKGDHYLMTALLLNTVMTIPKPVLTTPVSKPVSSTAHRRSSNTTQRITPPRVTQPASIPSSDTRQKPQPTKRRRESKKRTPPVSSNQMRIDTALGAVRQTVSKRQKM